MSPSHNPCCKEGLYKGLHQQTASSQLLCQLTLLCAYIPTSEHVHEATQIYTHKVRNVYLFFLCFIPILYPTTAFIPNPVPRLNTLRSYLAYFEGFGPELKAPNTFGLSADQTSIGPSLCRGHFERTTTVDFQGCFIRIKTQQEAEAQSPKYQE